MSDTTTIAPEEVFSFRDVEKNLNNKTVACFEVTYLKDAAIKKAVYRKRLPLGQRIAALESFGKFETDLAAMGVMAAYSLVELDGIPLPSIGNRYEAQNLLDRLDDDGLEAYIRVQNAMRPETNPTEKQNEMVGNS